MGYPQYENNAADIKLILQLAKKMNPFANVKTDDSKKNYFWFLNNDYKTLLNNLEVLAGPDMEGKDRAWEEVNEYLTDKSRFPFTTSENPEEITKTLSDGERLKDWEIYTLCRNLFSQVKVMQVKGEITAPDKTPEIEELSQKQIEYNNLLNDLGDDFAPYNSYKEFADNLEQTRKNESKLKFEYEQYQKPPVLKYINKTVEKQINGKIEQFNYEQIYDLYDKEAKKSELFAKNAQEKINGYLNQVKLLKEQNDKTIEELERLQKAVQNGRTEMSKLTKDVLETIEVGNIESKLSGDIYTIDDYFKKLDGEIKDRPIIAIRSKTKEEKNYQLARKAYLEGLRLKDKYFEGALNLEKQFTEIEEKYAKPYGKTLDELIRNAQLAKENDISGLDIIGVDPEHASADNALKEFNRIKEDFIKLYSVYSGNKNFQKQVRDELVPSNFLRAMTNTVNSFEDKYINPIIFKETEDHKLTDYEKKVNEGCRLLNANYSQMKETQKYIQECNKRIEQLNKEKIDPALFSQDSIVKMLSPENMKKFEKYGIKPDQDLSKLYRSMQNAEIQKESYEYERDKYEDLKDNFQREREYLRNFEANKQRTTTEYNKIKGSTEKLNQKNEKLLNVWKEYKEIQQKNNEIKDSLFNKDTSNSESYKDVLKTIEAELKRFKDTAKVGRDSIFKDSDAYTKMIKSIDSMFVKEEHEDEMMSVTKLATTDPAKLKDALDKVAVAAKQYLDAKAKQWRLFPSTQRVTRLSFAENLMTFAGGQSKAIEDIQAQMMGIENENKKTFTKVEAELGKDKINDPEDFFEHIIKPRAKNAEKEKLQNKEIVQNIPEKKNPEENTAENSKELNSFVK